MRRTKSLIAIIAVAVLLSCLMWAGITSANNGSAISYHNGPVMAGNSALYVIWYGSWVALTGPNSADTQRILNNFLASIGASIHSQINATYPGTNGSPAGAVTYGRP